FVTLDDSGADGLVPMRSLPDDFYVHDEAQHRLVGRRRGRVFRLGDSLTVRLETADGVTGSLTLSLLGDGDAAIAGGPRRPEKDHRPAPRERRAPRQRTGRRRS
ncbi:MAG: ribonuclease R, partial [Alphaproteobacteria bacterium]|nr:ribonuclease R [Alphaproteobacteria bacterium]